MNAPKRMDMMQRQRLESLDVLRGFDLFCLVGLEAVMHALDGAVDAPWFDRVMWCFTHVEWAALHVHVGRDDTLCSGPLQA